MAGTYLATTSSTRYQSSSVPSKRKVLLTQTTKSYINASLSPPFLRQVHPRLIVILNATTLQKRMRRRWIEWTPMRTSFATQSPPVFYQNALATPMLTRATTLRRQCDIPIRHNPMSSLYLKKFTSALFLFSFCLLSLCAPRCSLISRLPHA